MADKLTNVTNTQQVTDMYGNKLRPGVDYNAELNGLDPNGRENPKGGDWTEGRSNLYCATCKRAVSAEELAKPTHIGHGLEEGDGTYPNDVEGIARKGASYRLGFQTDGVKPLETVETYAKESDDPVWDGKL